MDHKVATIVDLEPGELGLDQSTTTSKSSLAKHSLLTSGATLISRITGLIRDLITANLFGATVGYDAFILAFRIPNLMRRLLAEGAFSQAFIPVFAEYTENKKPAEIKSFINKVAGNLALILGVITILGIIFADLLVKLFAPGFYLNVHNLNAATIEKFNITVKMLRIVFPYIGFISLTAFSAGILNCYHQFVVPAFTPVLLNLSLISCAWLLYNKLTIPEFSLGVGVIIAGILQLGFQLPFLGRLKLLPRLQLDWQDPGIKRILLLMIPALLSAAIGQINILIDSIFGSFLPTGSITWLYYADRLMEFPLGIFGGAFATVILPQLSRKFTNQNSMEFNQILTWGTKCTILIAAPASIGLIFIAKPLMSSLFFSGKFNSNDVINSSQALVGYAVSVLGIMLAKIFSNGFYAMGDLKTPLKIGAIVLIVNITLNFVLTKLIELNHIGIALATSIASVSHALMLYLSLLKKNVKLIDFNRFGVKIIISSIALSIFLDLYPACNGDWLVWSTTYKIFRLTEIVLLSILVYFGTLKLIGFKWNSIIGDYL